MEEEEEGAGGVTAKKGRGGGGCKKEQEERGKMKRRGCRLWLQNISITPLIIRVKSIFHIDLFH